MLIIDRKEGDSIEKAIRKYRRKRKETKLKRRLHERKYYTKPSEERRKEILKAEYVLQKQLEG